MVEMTQSKLDELCENFEEMKFKAGPWWPTIEEIKKYIEPHIDERMNFIIWITETADAPQTEEEKASKSYLMKLIYNNLNVVD